MTRRLLVALLAVALAGCPRRPQPPPPRQPGPVAKPAPAPVDAAVSDIATGGSWEEGGQSGIYRVVVRSGGRRTLSSDVVVQWLRWDASSEQPVEVKSTRIAELARGGIVVTASRIDDEDGHAVIKLTLANAVTGAPGEARIWPGGVGQYRAKVKWTPEATATAPAEPARPPAVQ